MDKKQWLGNYSKYSYLLLLIIPLFLTVYLRTMPVYLPGTDNIAEEYIQLQLKQKITDQVILQYPQLSVQERQKTIEQQFQEYQRDHAGEIEQLVNAQSVVYKRSFQDENNETYLYEIDPWHWYRLTKNYVEHGYEGDVEKDGKYYDTYIYGGLPLSFRPSSTNKVASFHVFMGGTLYQIVHVFYDKITLLEILFYLPVIFSIVAVISIFFLSRRIGGNLAGFFSALLFSFHPILLLRIIAGFSDTDIYSVLFPIVIIWFFIEAFLSESFRTRGMFILAAGILVGIYSFAWTGWWYTFYLVLAGLLLIIGTKIIAELFHQGTLSEKIGKGVSTIKMDVVISCIYIISSILSVFALKGINEVINGFLGPFNFFALKEISTENLWPNIFSTVGELQSGSVTQVIQELNPLLLFIAFAGLLFLCSDTKHFTSAGFSFGFFWISMCLGINKYLPNKTLFYAFLVFPLTIMLYVMDVTKFQFRKKNSSYQEPGMLAKPPWFSVFFPEMKPWSLLLSLGYLGIIISLYPLFSNMFFFIGLLFIPFGYVFIGMVVKIMSKQDVVIDRNNSLLTSCFAIVFFLWLGITLYSSVSGLRFLLLVIPPLAGGLGVGIAYLNEIIPLSLEQPLQFTKGTIKVVIIGLFLLLVSPIFIKGYVGVRDSRPVITDTWYNSLVFIKEHTSPEAIITSWWDYGHWFKAIANRSVTMDGGTQSAQQTLYIGKLLSTKDEKESARILRFLNCGSFAGYEYLNVIFNYDHIKTRDVLEKSIILPKADAADLFKKQGLNNTQVEAMLTYTHCNPPESILILSEDMIEKAFAWTQVGLWDFKRAQVLQYANKNKQVEALLFMQQEMNMSEDEAAAAYVTLKNIKESGEKNKWVAPELRYFEKRLLCEEKKDFFVCGNKVIFNQTNGEIYFQNGKKTLYPLLASYPNNNNQSINFFINKNSEAFASNKNQQHPLGISIFKEIDGDYYAYMMEAGLVESIFNRLYFYNGAGLTCFKQFHIVGNAYAGEKISIWEVNWSCLEET